jgi:hypothetical protein
LYEKMGFEKNAPAQISFGSQDKFFDATHQSCDVLAHFDEAAAVVLAELEQPLRRSVVNL